MHPGVIRTQRVSEGGDSGGKEDGRGEGINRRDYLQKRTTHAMKSDS